MGLSESIPVKCELCSHEYGELAIFKIYHHGYLGGHVICSVCYPNINHKTLSKNLKNELNLRYTQKTCCCCNYTNKNKLSRRLFKVYWIGKFGDKFMCEKCVYDKEYRRRNIQL